MSMASTRNFKLKRVMAYVHLKKKVWELNFLPWNCSQFTVLVYSIIPTLLGNTIVTEKSDFARISRHQEAGRRIMLHYRTKVRIMFILYITYHDWPESMQLHTSWSPKFQALITSLSWVNYAYHARQKQDVFLNQIDTVEGMSAEIGGHEVMQKWRDRNKIRV